MVLREMSGFSSIPNSPESPSDWLPLQLELIAAKNQDWMRWKSELLSLYY